MEFPKNQAIYDQLRKAPKMVVDARAQRHYANGLADREMPSQGDTPEWAAWVAGRRTRTDQGIA